MSKGLVKVTERQTIGLQKYRDTWQIVSVWDSNNGPRLNWCEREFGRDNKKRVPISIDLGESEVGALTTLRAIAAMIKTGETFEEERRKAPEPESGEQVPRDDDLPF